MRSSTLTNLRTELPMVLWALNRPHKERVEQLYLEAKTLHSKLVEGLVMDAAWLLPKQMAYWATIRLGAHATTGMYGNTDPSELLYMDVLKRAERTLLPKVLRRDVVDGGELGDVITCWRCKGRAQAPGWPRCAECNGTGELHRLKTLPPVTEPLAAE